MKGALWDERLRWLLINNYISRIAVKEKQFFILPSPRNPQIAVRIRRIPQVVGKGNSDLICRDSLVGIKNKGLELPRAGWMNPGEYFHIAYYQDSAGALNGGLKPDPSSLAGWDASPSAAMTLWMAPSTRAQ